MANEVVITIKGHDQFSGPAATVKAEARVNDRTVAEATLAFALVQGERNVEANAHCQRVKSLCDDLSSDPVGRAWESLAGPF